MHCLNFKQIDYKIETHFGLFPIPCIRHYISFVQTEERKACGLTIKLAKLMQTIACNSIQSDFGQKKMPNDVIKLKLSMGIHMHSVHVLYVCERSNSNVCS